MNYWFVEATALTIRRRLILLSPTNTAIINSQMHTYNRTSCHAGQHDTKEKKEPAVATKHNTHRFAMALSCYSPSSAIPQCRNLINTNQYNKHTHMGLACLRQVENIVRLWSTWFLARPRTQSRILLHSSLARYKSATHSPRTIHHGGCNSVHGSCIRPKKIALLRGIRVIAS